MRNKFAGTCYRCGKHVAPGDGHFERHNGGWRTQHADCAIAYRGTETGNDGRLAGRPSAAPGRAALSRDGGGRS